MGRSGSLAAVVLLLALAPPAPLCAQETTDDGQAPAEVPPSMLIEAARAALAAGETDDAALLLDGVPPGQGDPDDLDFLRGSIALQQSDWPAAIARFRAMLARNPDLPRVRLDLALAYFQAEDDGNAAYHFRLALGTPDLPEAVRTNALAFLERIRRRKRWSLTGTLALVPDTNINNATDARRILLGGVPATLSERPTSGVGVTADLFGGYEARLAPDRRFRIAGGLQTRTYRESRFNDRTLSARTGPRLLFERLDLRPELTAAQRWLGGEVYSRTLGLALSGHWLATPAWRVGASLARERVTYEGFLGRGHRDALGLDLAHALDKATMLRLDAGWQRETLDSNAHSWHERSLAVSASRELPFGFVARLGASASWRRYGAPQLWLGPHARRDRTRAAHLALSNRHVELFGFMPELTVRRERRDSNLVLYDYTRTVAELGLVRTF